MRQNFIELAKLSQPKANQGDTIANVKAELLSSNPFTRALEIKSYILNNSHVRQVWNNASKSPIKNAIRTSLESCKTKEEVDNLVKKFIPTLKKEQGVKK